MANTKFVADPRIVLCEVEETATALVGVADASLEKRLRTYAQEQGKRLDVVFPRPVFKQLVGGRTPLFGAPSSRSVTVSEVGFGECVRTFDAQGGFVRVATCHDSYLGWVPSEMLGELLEPTHKFMNLRGHVYNGPEVSAVRVLQLAYGAPVHVLGEGKGWTEIALEGGTGYVQSRALTPVDVPPEPTHLEPTHLEPTHLEPTPETILSFALRFLETPYLWGGVSAWGLDCSGLVQTVYRAHGVALPRDSDQQASCGREVAVAEMTTADLLFFPGHVALALGGDRFLHANAHHMRVTIDSLTDSDYGRGLRRALTRVVRLLP